MESTTNEGSSCNKDLMKKKERKKEYKNIKKKKLEGQFLVI